MARWWKVLVCLSLSAGLIAAAVVGYVHFWPRYLLAQAEKALAAEDWKEADVLLADLIRRKPELVQARFLHAQALRHLGRTDEARAALIHALNLGLPEADAARELALARATRQFDSVVAGALEQALQDRPDPEVARVLAEGYAATNRWTDADRCYTRWLELEPNRLEILQKRGQVRLTAASEYFVGRLENAAADFREILRRAPNDFDARLYLAHCLAADARMEEAREHLEICQRLRPDRVEPLVGLASCAIEERNLDQAEELLNRATQIEPNSVYVLVMRGDLCFRRGRYAEAIPFFEKVVAREPDNKAAHLKLAQALDRIGQTERAKEEEAVYRRLLQKKEEP
jgi:tetratricopeptide (TPR) repeat protein